MLIIDSQRQNKYHQLAAPLYASPSCYTLNRTFDKTGKFGEL